MAAYERLKPLPHRHNLWVIVHALVFDCVWFFNFIFKIVSVFHGFASLTFLDLYHVIFTSVLVEASFPIVGAWLGLLKEDTCRLKDGATFQPHRLPLSSLWWFRLVVTNDRTFHKSLAMSTWRVLSQSEISIGFYVLVCRTRRPQINRRLTPINGFSSMRDPTLFDFCQLVGCSRNSTSSGNIIYERLHHARWPN